MRLPPSLRERPQRGVRHSLFEGFRYIGGNEALRLLVTIALVPMFFGQPYQTMLTVFASQVYDIGPEGLGLLAASAACGSVLGAILVARLSHAGGRGIVMLGYLLAYGLALVAFSLNSWVLLAPVLLLLVGAMQVAYNASNNAIMQLSVPDHLRGRVLSTLFLNRGLVPLGTAFVAFLSTAIGAQLAMAATTSVIVVSALLLLAFSPTMRGLKVGGSPALTPP
jgi:MFS transporter, DHA1 family, staphyloferrin A biosynthesis exporter